MNIKQQIHHYIEDLIHFTDDQSDHQSHRFMLIGFLDAHLFMSNITAQQKQDYLGLMEQRFNQQEQQP